MAVYLDYDTEVKTLLSIQDSQDDKAEFLLASACALIERETRRLFSAQSISLVLSDTDHLQQYQCGRSLYDFGYYPITGAAISSVAQDVYRQSLVGVKSPTFPLTIVLSVGYAACPADIKQATLEVVKYNLSRFQSGQFGVRTAGMDSVNISYEFEIPLSARRVIDSYRMHTI